MPSHNKGSPPKLEVTAVGDWRTSYYSDRGPRLACRLTHPPTGFTDSVPITVRTQTRDNVCSLPLIVKQEFQGNSMKCWKHTFTIRAKGGTFGGKIGTIIVRARIRKEMEEWLAALNNHKNKDRTFKGKLWLKPSEEYCFFTLHGNTLSMRKAEATAVVANWELQPPSNKELDGCANHYERTLTLRAENRWQATVIFGFQLGFFMGPQQFVSSAPPQFGIRPVRSPWFEVTSSNRHTNRDTAGNRRGASSAADTKAASMKTTKKSSPGVASSRNLLSSSRTLQSAKGVFADAGAISAAKHNKLKHPSQQQTFMRDTRTLNHDRNHAHNLAMTSRSINMSMGGSTSIGGTLLKSREKRSREAMSTRGNRKPPALSTQQRVTSLRSMHSLESTQSSSSGQTRDTR